MDQERALYRLDNLTKTIIELGQACRIQNPQELELYTLTHEISSKIRCFFSQKENLEAQISNLTEEKLEALEKCRACSLDSLSQRFVKLQETIYDKEKIIKKQSEEICALKKQFKLEKSLENTPLKFKGSQSNGNLSPFKRTILLENIDTERPRVELPGPKEIKKEFWSSAKALNDSEMVKIKKELEQKREESEEKDEKIQKIEKELETLGQNFKTQERKLKAMREEMEKMRLEGEDGKERKKELEAEILEFRDQKKREIELILKEQEAKNNAILKEKNALRERVIFLEKTLDSKESAQVKLEHELIELESLFNKASLDMETGHNLQKVLEEENHLLRIQMDRILEEKRKEELNAQRTLKETQKTQISLKESKHEQEKQSNSGLIENEKPTGTENKPFPKANSSLKNKQNFSQNLKKHLENNPQEFSSPENPDFDLKNEEKMNFQEKEFKKTQKELKIVKSQMENLKNVCEKWKTELFKEKSQVTSLTIELGELKKTRESLGKRKEKETGLQEIDFKSILGKIQEKELARLRKIYETLGIDEAKGNLKSDTGQEEDFNVICLLKELANWLEINGEKCLGIIRKWAKEKSNEKESKLAYLEEENNNEKMAKIEAHAKEQETKLQKTKTKRKAMKEKQHLNEEVYKNKLEQMKNELEKEKTDSELLREENKKMRNELGNMVADLAKRNEQDSSEMKELQKEIQKLEEIIKELKEKEAGLKGEKEKAEKDKEILLLSAQSFLKEAYEHLGISLKVDGLSVERISEELRDAIECFLDKLTPKKQKSGHFDEIERKEFEEVVSDLNSRAQQSRLELERLQQRTNLLEKEKNEAEKRLAEFLEEDSGVIEEKMKNQECLFGLLNKKIKGADENETKKEESETQTEAWKPLEDPKLDFENSVKAFSLFF